LFTLVKIASAKMSLKSGFGNDVWTKKMRSFFSVMDFDNDGILTEDDFLAVVDRYITFAKLNQVEAKKVQRKIKTFYRDYFSELEKKGPITADGFIRACLFQGPEKMGQTCRMFIDLFFDLADINGDGVIKREEYDLFCKSFQLSPRATDISFEAVDINNSGVLGFDEYAKAGFDYFGAGDDSSRYNLFWGPLKE